jgi:hypothetical protein
VAGRRDALPVERRGLKVKRATERAALLRPGDSASNTPAVSMIVVMYGDTPQLLVLECAGPCRTGSHTSYAGSRERALGT